MRRLFFASLVAALALSALPAVALTADGPGPGGVTSANVTWVKHLPETVVGVSGRVVTVGEQVRFYTTGLKGLFIYDVTNPANPARLGFLPLAHMQNEDVSVSDDGKRVVIGADGGLLLPLNLSPGIHVIDTSDPANPKKVGFHSDSTHTASCADAACDWVYGSNGNTYDLRDPASPKKLTTGWRAYLATTAGGKVTLTQGAHDLNRDAQGYVITDTIPRVMMDVSDPARPTKVTIGKPPASKSLAYQHNNARVDADKWEPRDPASADYDDEALRPGELMVANGETNLQPRCNGSTNGPLATWSVKNFNEGAAMEVLEVFRPVNNGNYADGNPAVNVLGCSGHYFDVRDGVIAAAWFEHGTRFIEVDQTNGKMKEIGWWQPVVGSAGAAYWINDEYVYVTDYERGLDIIKIDRSATPPTQAESEANWLAGLDTPVDGAAQKERYVCSLSAGR